MGKLTEQEYEMLEHTREVLKESLSNDDGYNIMDFIEMHLEEYKNKKIDSNAFLKNVEWSIKYCIDIQINKIIYYTDEDI